MRGHHTVTVLRAPTTEDAYGNIVRNWAAATETVVSGCSVQPVIGDEATVNRETVVSRWRLFAPYDTDLLSSDRVRYEDVVYDVDGDVQRWEPGRRGYVTALLHKGG